MGSDKERRINVPIIKLVFVLVILVSTNGVYAGSWSYKNPVSPEGETIAINSDSNEISINNHRGFDWVECESDYYLCLLSGGMSFVIPKVPSDQLQWVDHQVTYRIIAKREANLLGDKIPDAILLSASYKGLEYQYFLYSYERGLIAISGLSDTSPNILIIEGHCGFGASAGCGDQ
jgi:hypothetical protein